MKSVILRRLRLETADSASLCQYLGVSQPTLSRILKPLTESGEIIRIGKGKKSRYGSVRQVPGLNIPEGIPVYSIDETGEAHHCGEIWLLQSGGSVHRNETDFQIMPLFQPRRDYLHAGLPLFLESLRPEGFLGRLLCRETQPISGLPLNPRDWTEDQILYFLNHFGRDLPGNIIAGRPALEAFFRQEYSVIRISDKEQKYAALAESVIAGENPGSSAGGEQPKFTAVTEDETGNIMHVIVKFSPESSDNPVSVRWRDLLIAEYTALSLLHSKGIGRSPDNSPSPYSLIRAGKRIMLEIQRYDRTGLKGRKPWISIGALEDELYGRRDSIRASLLRLKKNRLISEKDYCNLMVVSLFGDFIGNTDQHFGNVSFTWDSEGLKAGPLYDVLPMFYAPRGGGEILNGVLHTMPVPYPEESLFFQKARELASAYWENLSQNTKISSDFQSIASLNLQRISDSARSA